MEEEEFEKIAVEIDILERRVALDHCPPMGFALANIPRITEIVTPALGMKSEKVTVDDFEVDRSRSTINVKKTTRVNLSEVMQDTGVELIPSSERTSKCKEVEELIKLDVAGGQG